MLVVPDTIEEAVDHWCETVLAAKEKGLTVPAGGCSCSAHRMLAEHLRDEHLNFARFLACRLRNEEFDLDCLP